MRLKNSFGNCSKCGKQIMWIKTKAGKNMPCDPSFVYYKEQKGGKDRIVLTNGDVVVGTVQDYPEHATGFGYCRIRKLSQVRLHLSVLGLRQ